MERSPHLSLRVAAENLEPRPSCGLNTFVDHFTVALKRSTSPNTESGPQPIETAPRDEENFLILGEEASGKFDIARWAPEAGGWIRESGEPIKITPSYWHPIQEQNHLRPGLDISTGAFQPERRTAPQRQFASDLIASGSDVASPETMLAATTVPAVTTKPTAVEPNRASNAGNRFAAFLIASLVVAACVGTYFRAEVTAYAAQHVRGGPFGISTISGQVVGQVTQWLSQNLARKVSPDPISQRQPTPQVDAPALHIALLQHQAEVNGVGAQTSEATPAKAATLLEPAAENSQALASERDRGAALASELTMARGDVETKTALLSKAAGEVAQLRQAAEATAAELRQSLLQERDRVAALAHELATARRDLETEVALSRKAGEEAEQLRQAAKGATGELEQQRNRPAALAGDLESAQRVIGARSTTERPAGRQVDPMKQVVEQAATEPPRTAVQGNRETIRMIARASALLVQGNIAAARVVLERAAETGSAEASFALAETYDPNVLATWRAYGTRGDPAKARDLYARAYDGGIRAAHDRAHALVVGDGAPRPASWFGREEADH